MCINFTDIMHIHREMVRRDRDRDRDRDRTRDRGRERTQHKDEERERDRESSAKRSRRRYSKDEKQPEKKEIIGKDQPKASPKAQDPSDVSPKQKKSKKKRKRTADELEIELTSLRESREKYLRDNLKIKVELSTSKKNFQDSKSRLTHMLNLLLLSLN